MADENRRRPGVAKVAAVLLLGLLVAGMTVWGALFLWYSNIPVAPLRVALSGLFGIGTLAAFVFLQRRWRTLLGFAAVFALLVTWFLLIPPSNDREWAPEVAVMPSATVKGNLVEIRNIRNFEYRTATEFTPRYYDKTFDLDKLQSADLICVYWGMPAIAHIMASFGFGGDDFVVFSIEMRPERNEPSTMVRSLFRQYELIFIAADERDVIRLRTDFREPREQVYIYRTRLPIENQRKLFLAYAAKVDSLSRTPEWYNTLEDNCTTGVLNLTHAYEGRGRYNWKVLLSGFAAEYGYDLGMLDTSVPFAELSERGHVNDRAARAGDSPAFSSRIREGIPMPRPYTMQEFEAPQ
jgi:hypothetical protein